MSQQVLHIVTVKCDIPGCSSEITVNEASEAEEKRWMVEANVIRGLTADLCPRCVKEVVDFIRKGYVIETPEEDKEKQTT